MKMPFRSFPAFLSVLTALFWLGCGALPMDDEYGSTGEENGAITDGQTYTGHPAVGYIVVGGSTLCTATLVGQKTVLTAAHCIQPNQTHVFHAGGSTFTATSAVAHPSWNSQTKQNDIGVLLLGSAPALAPAVISRQAPFLGLPLTLIGYGVTATNAMDYGVKRKATNTVDTVTATTITFKGTGNGEGNTCFGDSGGPALATLGGKEVVVGVTSGGVDPCGTEGVDTRVDAFSTWLDIASNGDLASYPSGQGNCSVALSASPRPYTITAGTKVAFTATGSCIQGTPEYIFRVLQPNGLWATARAWSGSGSYVWDSTGAMTGDHYFRVQVRAQGTTASQGASKDFGYTVTGGVTFCSALSLQTSPSGSVPSGTLVSLTATPTCPPATTPLYKFMVKAPSGKWTTLQSWGTPGTVNWDTSSAEVGTHTLWAYVRGQASTFTLEAQAKTTVTVAAPIPVCTAVALATSPAAPQAAGTPVTLTAQATCPSGATPEYRFDVKTPDGVARTIRAWGTTNIATWDTQKAQSGSHALTVYLRASGATGYQAASTPATFAITSGAGYCNNAAFTVSPASPQVVGTALSLQAASSCTSGAVAEYRFMAYRPDGTLVGLNPFGPSSSLSVATTSWAAGTHRIYVLVRSVGSAYTYEGASAQQSYTLSTH